MNYHCSKKKLENVFKDSREWALNTNSQTTTILRKSLNIKVTMLTLLFWKYKFFLENIFYVVKVFHENVFLFFYFYFLKTSFWRHVPLFKKSFLTYLRNAFENIFEKKHFKNTLEKCLVAGKKYLAKKLTSFDLILLLTQLIFRGGIHDQP